MLTQSECIIADQCGDFSFMVAPCELQGRVEEEGVHGDLMDVQACSMRSMEHLA